VHDVRCCALQQLEAALFLYFEREDYYSAITLAGAAEEIFGQLLRARDGQSSYDSYTKNTVALKKILSGEYIKGEALDSKNCSETGKYRNMVRNFLKHYDWGRGSQKTLRFDARQEAQDMLRSAIDNYYYLESNLTPAMQKFDSCTVKDEPRLRSNHSD